MNTFWQLFDRLLRFFAFLSGTIICAIVLGITLNVFLRNFLGSPIYGLLELVEYGLLLTTFLGAPWVLAKHAHVTVDLIAAALPMAAARFQRRAVAIIGAATCALVAWYGFQAVLISLQKGSMVRASFVFPEWWVLSVMPASFVLLVIEFLRQFSTQTQTPQIKVGL